MRTAATFVIFMLVAGIYIAAGVYGMATGDFTLATTWTPAALLAFVFLGGRQLAELRNAARPATETADE